MVTTMGQRTDVEVERLRRLSDPAFIDCMLADVIRRSALLDRLCEEVEMAAIRLDARVADLEMREADLIKASIEMRDRKGAFGAP